MWVKKWIQFGTIFFWTYIIFPSEEHKTGSGAGLVKKCQPAVPGAVTRLWGTSWSSPTSPLHFNWHLPYLLLFKSTLCKHTQSYTTTGVSVPIKNPLYCKSCFVQSCWRPLLTEYYWSENPIFFGGLWSSLLVQAPQRKSLLCDHKQYKQKQPAVTLLNASNFCYFYKSVFYQQLNDADVDNIIYSLMFEELLFL